MTIVNTPHAIPKQENERIEFKTSLAEWKEIIETISAFSNTHGGSIFIGVSDSGEILGVNLGKKSLEDLADKIKQSTDPKTFPNITILEIGKFEIIKIDIEESDLKPVFAFDKVFKRVGKTNQRVTSHEIRKIFSKDLERLWDAQALKVASKKDIDWKFFKDFFIPRYEERAGSKIAGSPQALLSTLECICGDHPTNAGILLFGKDPQRFFMNGYIALARYKARAVSTERLDYKEFHGNLFQQIDDCDKYIHEHMAMMSKQYPGVVERKDIPEYGLFTIRELITNAVCHRDYRLQGSKVIIKMFEGSIEFYNPGGLSGDITLDNITQQQYSRNPVIAKTLAKIGYIEELGEGWDKLLEEHKKHPLHPKTPKITTDEHSMLVTIFSTKETFERFENATLNERQKKALKYLETHDRLTNADYRAVNPGISDRQTLNDLHDMIKKGLIVRIGEKKGAYYKKT